MQALSCALARPLPSRDADLPRTGNGQLPCRGRARDGRARTDGRACADLHRRDQHAAGANEHIIINGRRPLVGAIVVAGHRTGTDIDSRTDRRITQVGEMVGLGSDTDARLLDLDEVADVHPFGEF